MTEWVLYAEATDYAKTGGEASSQDVTTLAHLADRSEPGNPGAESLQVSALATDVASEALQLVRRAARAGGMILVRITHLKAGGTVRHCAINPGQPSENVSKGGAPATTSFSGGIIGYWCEGVA